MDFNFHIDKPFFVIMASSVTVGIASLFWLGHQIGFIRGYLKAQRDGKAKLP